MDNYSHCWSLSLMCWYQGGDRAQPNLLLTFTEYGAVPIAKVSLSHSSESVFGLGRCVFGTRGDEKQSVFIREEPFVCLCGKQTMFRGTAQAPRGAHPLLLLLPPNDLHSTL